MIDRDKIVAAYPIAAFLEKMGHPVEKAKCKCPFHDDSNPSCSVDEEKGLWYCFTCGFGGSVIDLAMRSGGLSVKEAMAKLAIDANLVTREELNAPHKTDTYEYRDEAGRLAMKVDRIDSGRAKKFSQYREVDGQRVNSIAGVQRVLYRLEKWTDKNHVHLCEGEKCVHALESLGFPATCNAGGSGAWLAAYSSYLSGKSVDIWVDDDEPGEKWREAVLDSLEGKVEWLRVLRVPAPYNDIADLVDAQGKERAMEMVADIMDKAVTVSRGVNIPLLSAEEVYENYTKRVREHKENAIDLGKWLPSLNQYARPLTPGDLMVFMSDTGVGKTAALLNLVYSQRPIPTIFFELELSSEAMCERFIARDTGVETLDVEKQVRRRGHFDVSGWGNIFICPKSKIDLEEMENIILRAELKMQAKPRLIVVDYIGLMSGGMGKRYERMSTIAEGLKVLARTTETVVVLASQVRRDPGRVEIDLHDSKDSGSIENSAQLVLGAWRPSENEMVIKVLKQTKRAGQTKILCNFDGNRQLITERSVEVG